MPVAWPRRRVLRRTRSRQRLRDGSLTYRECSRGRETSAVAGRAELSAAQRRTFIKTALHRLVLPCLQPLTVSAVVVFLSSCPPLPIQKLLAAVVRVAVVVPNVACAGVGSGREASGGGGGMFPLQQSPSLVTCAEVPQVLLARLCTPAELARDICRSDLLQALRSEFTPVAEAPCTHARNARPLEGVLGAASSAAASLPQTPVVAWLRHRSIVFRTNRGRSVRYPC